MTRQEYTVRNQKIIQLAKEHKTADEIASVMGIKKLRVLQILKSFNVKAARPFHRLESEKARAILKELNAGTKQCEIARLFNVSRQYVNQISKKKEILKKK